MRPVLGAELSSIIVLPNVPHKPRRIDAVEDMKWGLHLNG